LAFRHGGLRQEAGDGNAVDLDAQLLEASITKSCVRGLSELWPDSRIAIA